MSQREQVASCNHSASKREELLSDLKINLYNYISKLPKLQNPTICNGSFLEAFKKREAIK